MDGLKCLSILSSWRKWYKYKHFSYFLMSVIEEKIFDLVKTFTLALSKESDKVKYTGAFTYKGTGDNTEIISLIKTESVLMLDKSDSLVFAIDLEIENEPKLAVFLSFVDDNELPAQSYTVETKMGSIEKESINKFHQLKIQFNKWYGEWIENKEPFEFTLSNKDVMSLKIRSTANLQQPYRQITFSIWKWEKKAK